MRTPAETGACDFRARLREATAPDRSDFLAVPLIGDALSGRLSRERYVGFLGQAWHHVRATVPLMMAAMRRLPPGYGWLKSEMDHYVDEEQGHERWILSDIVAAGGSAEAAEAAAPNPETDALLGYAWDTVQRRNPVGFFGMVYVLEGASVDLAVRAADAIEKSLGLPAAAFTYLRSHGIADVRHIEHLAGILDRLPTADDQDAVLRSARAVYWLYASVFRGVDRQLQRAHAPAGISGAGAWT